MTHLKSIALAGAVAVSGAFAASDADALPFALSGDFEITAYNYTPSGTAAQRRDRSAATESNFDAISLGTPNIGNVVGSDVFNYSGVLSFRQGHNANATTTISDWLNTSPDAPSGLSNLDPTFGGHTLSAGQGTGDGSAGGKFVTTTLFKITATSLNIGDLGDLWNVNHDDGVTFQGASGSVVATAQPTTEDTTDLFGELSGSPTDFVLYYAAANGNPSVLEVNAIPLPAAAWLLLGVTGGLVAAKRRSARRAA